MNNDELLNELTSHIESLVIDLGVSVKRYQETQYNIMNRDLSQDTTYHPTYIKFYKLRLPRTDCYGHYFDLLQHLKTNSNMSFEDVLLKLKLNTGRIEASFASKLLATIDPKRPVIDSIVLDCLGYQKPKYYEENRLGKTVSLYSKLGERFRELEQDKRFNNLKHSFLLSFPDSNFTNLKILDLLIWEYGKSRITKKRKKSPNQKKNYAN